MKFLDEWTIGRGRSDYILGWIGTSLEMLYGDTLQIADKKGSNLAEPDPHVNFRDPYQNVSFSSLAHDPSFHKILFEMAIIKK